MKKFNLALLSLLLAVGMIFTSCGDKDPTKQFTVTFETNGGSAIESLLVDEGDTVTKPENPTKDGYEFDGWFTDSALTQEFDFESEITADTTVYAKWKQKTVYYTVTFETNGGTAIEPVEVEAGKKLENVTAPTKEGFEFGGWYTDKACQTKFSSSITKDITLYAKWNAKKVLPNGNVEVTEEKKDSSGKLLETVKVTKDKSGALVQTETVKKQDDITKTVVETADGAKTIKDEYDSGIVVDTSITKDNEISATAKDKEGNEIPLNEYDFDYDSQCGDNGSYTYNFFMDEYFQNQEIVEGDVIKFRFVGVTKDTFEAMAIQAAVVSEMDGYWKNFTDWTLIHENLIESATSATFELELPVITQAYSSNLNDYLVQLIVGLTKDEGRDKHREKVSLLGNLSVELDKTNRKYSPVDITFDDEGNKETKTLFPGRKLQPATSKQNEMLFFGWKDGSGKKWDLVPDTSCELTADWSNRISSPNGRLTVKMDKDKRLYELEVTQLEEEPRPDQFWKFYNFTIKENATTRLGINIKETIEFENKQKMFMKDVEDTDHLWTYTVKFPFAKKGEKLRFEFQYQTSDVTYLTETVEFVSPFDGKYDYKDFVDTDQLDGVQIICDSTEQYNFKFSKDITPAIKTDNSLMKAAYAKFETTLGNVYWDGALSRTGVVSDFGYIFKDKTFTEEGETKSLIKENVQIYFPETYKNIAQNYPVPCWNGEIAQDFKDIPTWFISAPIRFSIDDKDISNWFITDTSFTLDYKSEAKSYYYSHPEKIPESLYPQPGEN